MGVVARVTCETAGEYGYEAEDVTVLSQATDGKGYFLATLSPSEVKDYEKVRIKECRAFLELSPADTCSFPTEINRGKRSHSTEISSPRKQKQDEALHRWPFRLLA
ncbi:unnamed protein product [Thlaspi arvense]|uniref:Uncharacterized protein n=1 Tax=Thlaspi arvense TaxID=13288 RepID=A0AAU9S3C4_THLAR|nr:unnamed protein product [Thlaspi arvense]